MKLTLHPSFSTTYFKSIVGGKITIDTSFRKVKSATSFTLQNGEPRLTLDIAHPLQDGHTTYFLETSEDIQAGLDYCIANNVTIYKH